MLKCDVIKVDQTTSLLLIGELHLFAILRGSIRRTGATPIVVGTPVATARGWLVWTIGCLLVLFVLSLPNRCHRPWARRPSRAGNTKREKAH